VISVPARDRINPVSVLLTFDFDAYSIWLGTYRTQSPGSLSRGEFGARVAAPRILDLLAAYEIRSTWFIPGHTIDTFPEICRRVVHEGHEVAYHGYAHENPVPMARAEEADTIHRGMEAIRRLTGTNPKGCRSPAWDTSPNTISLLEELGFEWDSSLMAEDHRLYWCRTGDRVDWVEPARHGQTAGIVEVPVSWSLDDWPALVPVWDNPYRYGYTALSTLEEYWSEQFRYVYENVPGGVFCLTVHPQVIGRGHTLRLLERIIQLARAVPGVRFQPVSAAVGEWKAAGRVLPA